MTSAMSGDPVLAPRRVIVGFKGGTAGADALAFAARWSKTAGAALSVVTVHQDAAAIGAGRGDAEWIAHERAEADRLLQQARELVPAGVEASFVRLASGSASHGLHDALDMAAPDESHLLVLGSGRHRGMRRTYPGSTAERLLQGSPAPIALVPWGYAESTDAPITRVAVAYVDTLDGKAAFAGAVGLAEQLGAELTVLSVVPDTRVNPGLGELRVFGREQQADFQAALDQVVATAPSTVTTTGRLLDGPVVDALTDLTFDDFDLLVCGSRGYGPVRRVFLGGVSSRVLKHSRIPVVVAPRAH